MTIRISDEAFIALMASMGYLGTRKLPTGEWAAVSTDFIYTYDLCVGLDETGNRTRFLYRLKEDALMALEDWDGKGDPPGKWLKEKGRTERWNPAIKEGDPVIDDTLVFREEKGWLGTFTRYQTPDAPFKNGTKIKKVFCEQGDAHPIGALGTVLGSVSAEAAGFGYFVEWQDRPNVAVFVIEKKIGAAS